MLSTYHKACKLTRLTGPTYFAETLKRFLYIVKREQEMIEEWSLYFIFVIITDGCIHDMKETCKLIVDLSYHPVSIIIVGVGDADFTQMEVLDDDEKAVSDYLGRTAARDIVQFVPFDDLREMSKNEVDLNLMMEVPHHFVDYMVQKQINPMMGVHQDTNKPEVEVNDAEKDTLVPSVKKEGTIDNLKTDHSE